MSSRIISPTWDPIRREDDKFRSLGCTLVGWRLTQLDFIMGVEKDYSEVGGYAVDIVISRDVGLCMAFEQSYDLIVLDLMLPGTDGFEICKQVRQASRRTRSASIPARHDPGVHRLAAGASRRRRTRLVRPLLVHDQAL